MDARIRGGVVVLNARCPVHRLGDVEDQFPGAQLTVAGHGDAVAGELGGLIELEKNSRDRLRLIEGRLVD